MKRSTILHSPDMPVSVLLSILLLLSLMASTARAQQADHSHPMAPPCPQAPPVPPAAGTPSPLDAQSETKLRGIEGPVGILARRFIHDLLNRHDRLLDVDDVEARISQGYRTYAEQDALYAKGRTTDGPRVTNARGGHSNHNFKLAFDITLYTKKPRRSVIYRNGRVLRVIAQPGDPLEEGQEYTSIGRIGESYGLDWGGDWRSFKDRPHYQWRMQPGITQAQSLRELRRLRNEHGDGGPFLRREDCGWAYLDAATRDGYFNH